MTDTDDRLRRGLHVVASSVQPSPDALGSIRRRVVQRHRRRRAGQVMGAVGTAALLFVGVVAVRSRQDGAVVVPMVTTPAPTAALNGCGPPPFTSASLPEAFSAQWHAGLGGGVSQDATTTHDDYYLEGGQGRFIQFARDNEAYPVGGATTAVTVLGVEAQTGTVEDGWGAEFSLGPDRCDRYLVNAFGISRDAFAAFLSGLRRP
jgi:hypothetical protein